MSELIEFSLPMRRPSPFSPPALYTQLREHHPVARAVLPDGQLVWLVARHDDVRAALKNPLLSSDPRRPGFPEPDTSNRAPFLIEMDAPRHTELRKLLAAEFSPQRLAVLQEHIDGDATKLLDAMLAGSGHADLVAAYALPLASLTICHLLGVPYAEHAFFERSAVTLLSHDDAKKGEAFGAICSYFEQLLEEKKRHPSDNLLGRLIAGPWRAGQLSDEELLNIAVILLMAGFETTATMISLGVVTLLHHAGQLALLQSDMALIDEAVEELLRYHTPGDTDALRVAIADTEIDGQPIARGEAVIPLLWSANRDPAVFPLPDNFDIRREQRGQLAFGYGMHQCIGLNLARMEMRTALRRLFTRAPTLRLAIPLAELPFRYDSELFGLAALPVQW
jgi:cytochrome P450